MFTSVLLAMALVGADRPSELPHPVLVRLSLLKRTVNYLNITSNNIERLKGIAVRSPDLAGECAGLIADLERQRMQLAGTCNRLLGQLAADTKRRAARLIKPYLPAPLDGR